MQNTPEKKHTFSKYYEDTFSKQFEKNLNQTKPVPKIDRQCGTYSGFRVLQKT